MSNEDEEKNVQAREKVVEPPLVDRVEGQDGHPVDTPPVLAVDNPDGQGGQGDGQPRTTSKDRMDNPVDTSGQPPDRVGTTPDNLDGQDGQPPLSRVDNPLLVAEARPLTGKNRTRWREDYRAVFGEVDELFEARVSRAMRLMENGAVRSRKEALEKIGDLPPETNSQEEPGGKTAPMSGEAQPGSTSFSEDTRANRVRIETEENRSRLKWIEAYRTVFGEEPNGQLAEARMRAAMNFYSPERSVGRRQALEAVRASEEEAASRTREAERVFEVDEPDDPLLGRAGPVHRTDEEPEGEWLPLPSEDALTLGAALMKIGRLEAEVEELRRAVARLEAGLHRSETRLGGMAPGLRALREAVREARDLALKVSHRVDTLAPASSSEDKSLPPGKKELRELRARMDEERGRILLEVENRLEEAEELMRRSTENRIAALESWVRRVSRYLGIGKKGGFFR
ncbi:MAG: hypothetical protein K6T70_15025 [Meiothermus ruber]|uniref:hypothetical protein n=1 Tax=Meiothermus ruber TaxID=277 RepID=UPI0023F8BF18|nr:hypothetical protein [Meiothermus ruber]MCL6531406.1 hypothetical protein [Meiothermus ruber]